MGIIGRITAGGIMHHCHSSKLIQRRADTRHVCRVDWYDPICLSHMQLSHPHPFRTIRSSGAFSSLNASSISCAVRLIPSKPQSPPPCTILTKFRLPVNQAAFCPTARIFPECCRGRTLISGRTVEINMSSG
jgi:hypothetical protein